jgi:GABA(A) receptor-associated protein
MGHNDQFEGVGFEQKSSASAGILAHQVVKFLLSHRKSPLFVSFFEVMSQGEFKLLHPLLEERTAEALRIMKKYPGRIPVVCEKHSKTRLDPVLENTKYLVPEDLTVAQLAYVVRKRMKLKPDTALFLMTGANFPSASTLVGQLYDEYKDEDGFLYFTYSAEQTFG